MAHCRKCGKWAGLVNRDHDYDCVKDSVPSLSEQELLVRRLRPHLIAAGRAAGVAAALTLVGISLLLTVLWAIIRLLFESPSRPY